jgi:hypothetical protein
MKKKLIIIQQPINKLPMSQSFQAIAGQLHFRTLADIVNWPVSLLLQHPGFTYHHYHEFGKYLQQHNLHSYLKY